MPAIILAPKKGASIHLGNDSPNHVTDQVEESVTTHTGIRALKVKR